MARGTALTDDENELIRKLVRQLVEEHGSQAQVARVLGITQAAISSLLSGRTGAGLSLARKLAAHFGASLDELLHASDFERVEKSPTVDPAYLEAAEELLRVARTGQFKDEPEALTLAAKRFASLFESETERLYGKNALDVVLERNRRALATAREKSAAIKPEARKRPPRKPTK